MTRLLLQCCKEKAMRLRMPKSDNKLKNAQNGAFSSKATPFFFFLNVV